jgi:hypothetical protein
MSQWGAERSFAVSSDTTIRVIAHVTTRGFAPICAAALVDDLLLLHVEGDRALAAGFLGDLRRFWTGRFHRDWQRAAAWNVSADKSEIGK